MLKRLCCTAALAALVVFGCDREQTVAPEQATAVPAAGDQVEAVALELARTAGWPIDESQLPEDLDLDARARPMGCLQDFTREELIGDVVHYSVQIRVGDGPHDYIGLHRVVKERHPYRPIQARECLFLVHGLSGYFDNGFLDPASSVDKASSVVFARNDVDVWGIDFGWALVTSDVTDIAFFDDWGMEKDVDHLRKALGIARFTRAFTGSGFGKVNLLGHSYGAGMCYAYGGMESQLPRGLRHVETLIPVDVYFKSDDAYVQEYSCGLYEDLIADLAAGEYAGNRDFIYAVAELARTAPEDTSPYFGWLNNLDAAILVGTSTQLFTPNTPTYHLLAGVFEEGGYPTVPQGLAYTSIEAWLTKLEGFCYYVPKRIEVDLWGTVCDTYETTIDDHLSDITVPVFYIGAAGAFGETGVYTTTFLGSSDVTTYVITLEAPEDIGLDYGHNDLFMADNAVELVYQPILDWIAAR